MVCTRTLRISTFFSMLRSASMYVRWMLVALVGVLSTTLVMRGEAASLDVAFPLYKLQDVLGRAVTTPQGKEVGHIENVILDAATRDLLSCRVTSGGVLGGRVTLRTLAC